MRIFTHFTLFTLLVLATAPTPAATPQISLEEQSQVIGQQQADFLLARSIVTPGGHHIVNIVSMPDGRRRIWIDGQLGPPQDEIDPFTILSSPDGKRVVYLARRRALWYVYVDGKESRPCDQISREHLRFSPDSSRFGFVGNDNRRFLAVVEAQEMAEFGHLVAGAPALYFSPNSKRVAVLTATADKRQLYLDGEGGPEFPDIIPASIAFSHDASRFSYVAIDGNAQMAVINNQVGPRFDGIGAPGVIFSPNGKRSFYWGRRANMAVPVVDGKELPRVDQIVSPAFSPDGSNLFYVAAGNSREQLVINGLPGKTYDVVAGPTPTQRFVISPDSRHYAFAARLKSQEFVIHDGVESPPFAGVAAQSITFSPDGKRLACIAQPLDGGQVVVLDGKPLAKFDAIVQTSLRFSPDGQRLFFDGIRNGKGWAVIDGKELGPYDDRSSTMTFSPDSKRVAYAARRGSRWFMVVDGVEQSLWDALVVGYPVFSDDSRRCAYVAIKNDRFHVVVDGVQSQPLLSALSPLKFAGPDSISLMGARLLESGQAQFLRLTYTIKSK